jgi:hypothetical protein
MSLLYTNRPISLTCICCKLLEHLIVKHIMSHADTHNILYPLQHGFRTGRSCETQLLEFIDDVTPSSGPVRKGSEVCSTHARVSSRFFLTSVVVQVSWLPKVARRGERVCACATRSCAKSALMGTFPQK